jgi:hypothetical protein
MLTMTVLSLLFAGLPFLGLGGLAEQEVPGE